MCFLQKKFKKSVKFGLGVRSNISLPRIGGSHPVPSLSLLLTERRGYSNVLLWVGHGVGHGSGKEAGHGVGHGVVVSLVSDLVRMASDQRTRGF